MKNVLLVLVLSSSLGAAQESTPLTVKGHTIGESVAEFAAVIGVDYTKCIAVAHLSQKQARHQKLPWDLCHALVAAESSGPLVLDGWFDSQKLPYPLSCKSNVDAASCEKLLLQIAPSWQWQALLEDGRLAQFRIELDPKYSYADVLSELSVKYGKPASEKTVTLQNAFGAKAEAGEAFWHLSSGDISEIETVLPPSYGGGWERIVHVGYYSKTRSEALTRSMGKDSALN